VKSDWIKRKRKLPNGGGGGERFFKYFVFFALLLVFLLANILSLLATLVHPENLSYFLFDIYYNGEICRGNFFNDSCSTDYANIHQTILLKNEQAPVEF